MVRAVERLLSARAPRFFSRSGQICADLLVLVCAFLFAYQLRFDFAVPRSYQQAAGVQILYVLAIQIVVLRTLGIYRFVWRYIGMAEIRAFIVAAVVATLPILGIRLLVPDAWSFIRVPLSVIIMDALLGFGAVLGIRVLRRAIYEASERKNHHSETTKSVLLIGAGQGGMLAARELLRRADAGIDIKGFIDDDPAKIGTSIHGVTVLGSTAELPRFVAELDIDHVIITIAQAPRESIRRIIDICDSIPIKARIIPGMYEILGGKVEVSRIRNVEIEDLLGRDPIQLGQSDIERLITDKVVMVTGAGGSIGSELARQAARFSPARLLLVERAEFALFDIDRELRNTYPDLEIEPLVADTGDEVRIRKIFARYRPHVVVHAAAHKHVPMMELQPSEAIKNNVLTTRLLGHVAGEFDAEAFVLISTDKAVNPTSVMGASKRVAELVVQDLSQLHYKTRFVGVRFGNVMGSAGSVIPIFRKQIAAGGPVTVTHPEMTRYFMTIPEASQLVLQAGAIGEGGEIFVLDMGEPVRILDMAERMIRLSGFKPHEEIEIRFSGIRPGEKLYEELDRMGETISKTKHPKIFNGNLTPYPRTELREALLHLETAARKGMDNEVRARLSALLPEAHLEAGSHIDVEPAVTVADARPLVDVGAVRLPIRGEEPAANEDIRPAAVFPRAVN